MAQETIDAIRKAETQAAELEARAAQEAEKIVKEAKEKAAQEKIQKLRSAQAAGDASRKEALARCSAMMEEAAARQENEARQLAFAVADRKAEARKAVLSYLLQQDA